MQEPKSAAEIQGLPATRGPFFEDTVLRPGWSFLLFLVFFLSFARSITSLALSYGMGLYSMRRPHLRRPIEHAPEAIALMAFFLAMYVVSLLDQRQIASYGYRSAHKARLFGMGCLSALVTTVVLVGGQLAAGLQTIGERGVTGLSILKYAALHAAAFLVVSLLEQSAVRGFLQYNTTRGMTFLYSRIFGVREPVRYAFWTASLVFTGLFTAGQTSNYGETTTGLIASGLLGLICSYSLWRTGSLWWAIGFNFFWEFSQAFFGVPAKGMFMRDRLFAVSAHGNPLLSGGAAGPEGSVLIFIAIAALWFVVRALPLSPLYPDLFPDPTRTNTSEPKKEIGPHVVR